MNDKELRKELYKELTGSLVRIDKHKEILEYGYICKDDVKDDVNEILNKIFPLIKSHRIEWLKGILGEEIDYDFHECFKKRIPRWDCPQCAKNEYRSQILKNAEKEEKL